MMTPREMLASIQPIGASPTFPNYLLRAAHGYGFFEVPKSLVAACVEELHTAAICVQADISAFTPTQKLFMMILRDCAGTDSHVDIMKVKK